MAGARQGFKFRATFRIPLSVKPVDPVISGTLGSKLRAERCPVWS